MIRGIEILSWVIVLSNDAMDCGALYGSFCCSLDFLIRQVSAVVE